MSLSVIHILKHEHRIIERVLRALEGVCYRLGYKEAIPTETLTEIVDFISGFVDGFHHTKEEAHLFPALQRQGIVRDGGPLGLIEHEHGIERDLINELKIAIEGLKVENEVSRRVFIETAHRYIKHLTNHMQQEDAILFRLAEELLDSSEAESLTMGFRQAEKEFGEGAVRQYEELAANLEERWAV
jgi:hemerythrin-like domain-containing protein